MTNNRKLKRSLFENLFIHFTVIFILISPIHSLNKNNFYSNIALLNEGVMIPIYSGFTSIPIHPGLMVGCEYRYKESNNLHLFQSFNIGGYYHQHFEHGIYCNSEFGVRPIFNFGLTTEILLGFGYLHTIEDDPLFSQNSSGEYVQMRNYGRPHLMGTFSLGLGYDFSKMTNLILIPYVRYQTAVEYPYSLNNGEIPVLMHTMLYFGLIYDMHRIFNFKRTKVN